MGDMACLTSTQFGTVLIFKGCFVLHRVTPVFSTGFGVSVTPASFPQYVTLHCPLAHARQIFLWVKGFS